MGPLPERKGFCFLLYNISMWIIFLYNSFNLFNSLPPVRCSYQSEPEKPPLGRTTIPGISTFNRKIIIDSVSSSGRGGRSGIHNNEAILYYQPVTEETLPIGITCLSNQRIIDVVQPWSFPVTAVKAPIIFLILLSNTSSIISYSAPLPPGYSKTQI